MTIVGEVLLDLFLVIVILALALALVLYLLATQPGGAP